MMSHSQSLISGLHGFAMALYLLATLFYLLRHILSSTRLGALGLRSVLLASVVQIILFIGRFASGLPLFETLSDYFQLSAVVLAMSYVVLCFTKRFYSAGLLFLAPINLLLILSFIPNEGLSISQAAPGHGYLFLHLVSIFLSLPIFCVAFVSAVMFLMLEQKIKSKHLSGLVSRFPSLAVLEEIHYRSIYVAFLLFTFVIFSGAGYAKMMTGHYITGDLKQILSVLSWVLLAVFLNFRVSQGWQGHKGIILSFAGFASVLLLFIVGLT